MSIYDSLSLFMDEQSDAWRTVAAEDSQVGGGKYSYIYRFSNFRFF